MLAPRYIKRELELIDPLYFAVLNPCVDGGMSNGNARWQIRKWKGVVPKNIRLWDTDLSEVIVTICREQVTEDEGLIDVGYQELDRRIITAIRESHWWKLKWKKRVAEIDWKNEKRERQGKEELEYQAKNAAKMIWRAFREPTVCLSGKEWGI